VIAGNVASAMQESKLQLAGRDAYIAGPPAMIRAVLEVLHGIGISGERIHVDSFGAG
jgi:CDP-4-dehydro-6-deoxyglucose reductase